MPKLSKPTVYIILFAIAFWFVILLAMRLEFLRATIISLANSTLTKVHHPAPPDTPSVVDISNWKTYRNEKYGFEFKYPSSWTLSNVPPGDREVLSMYIAPRGRTIIDQQIEGVTFGVSQSSTIDYDGYGACCSYTTSTKKINGAPWTIINSQREGIAPASPFWSAILEKDGNLIGFGAPLDNSSTISVLDKILSTFKFTN